MLIDQYHRTISYLRLSVTDRCNLKCFYCKPVGIFNVKHHSDMLTFEELYRLVEIAASLGVKKVRLTGGEPLVRKGVVDFIPRLASVRGLEDVSLTTNGVLLKNNLEKIFCGGIHRLNISMDTLRRERYCKITGADRFDEVWETIDRAVAMNFQPIKINMVVINGVNDDEVVEMAKLSLSKPYHIRFIEYMPVGVNRAESTARTVPISQIKSRIETLGRLIPVEKNANDGPAQRYSFDGAPGEIGFISSLSNHFCSTCNRLRLTADGKLRSCLLHNIDTDIKGPLRAGATDDDLAGLFQKAVNQKPMEHLLTSPDAESVYGRMHMIGG